MHAVGDGAWDLYSGTGCAGPWSAAPFRSGVTDPTAVPDQDSILGTPSAADAPAMDMQLCRVGGEPVGARLPGGRATTPPAPPAP